MIFVLVVKKLSGFVDAIGEKGKGVSDEEGEWDNGVVISDGMLLIGRCICEGGRGMGTPCVGRGTYAETLITEVEGEDEPEKDGCGRRWVGCDRASVAEDRPMRLSTERPS